MILTGSRDVQKIRLAVQARNPRLRECRDERSGAPIEYRRLRAIHVDGDVVDAHSSYGGENMLYRMDRVLTLAELCSTLAGADLADVRLDARKSRADRCGETRFPASTRPAER